MTNKSVLKKYFVGQQISFEHPDGKGEREAKITSFAADSLGKLNGIIVQFKDNVIIEIEARFL